MKKAFEELHKFLRDEEAARLRELKQEAESCSSARKAKSGEEIANLSRKVKNLEEKMGAKDPIRFLQVTETVMQTARHLLTFLQASYNCLHRYCTIQR